MFIGAGFRAFYADDKLADQISVWGEWLLDGAGPSGDPPVDLGPAAVELAVGRATRLGRAGVRTLDLADHDPARLPFADGSVSALLAILVLQHLPDPNTQDQALAEWRRVLQPGGALIALCPLDGPHLQGLDVEGRCCPIDPLKLPERVRSAGFTEVVTRVWSLVGVTAR